ncbi:DUF1638 domain-containing protein [Methanosarcina barkeri]|uniref:DUF1638 domain-containing protein n=1 Tax=Methanosarcina barkeri TaxID=2208 RepID=UPI000B09B3B7|nr:DUF1638 domain-containing protein [Methanosarcina barkeri]
MTVLGIVGCRIFEDEITHVLANDSYIDRIYIIENEENKGLLHKLEAEGCKPVFLPFYKIKADLRCSNKFSVIVQLQGMGLHVDPARLKNETYTNVDIMSRSVDGILLFLRLLRAGTFQDTKKFCSYEMPYKIAAGQGHR